MNPGHCCAKPGTLLFMHLLGKMTSWPAGKQHRLASLHANISLLIHTSALDCESHAFSSFWNRTKGKPQEDVKTEP